MAAKPMFFPTPMGEGLSLRDWFAGQALAGLISGELRILPDEIADAATNAYVFADAMLAERDK